MLTRSNSGVIIIAMVISLLGSFFGLYVSFRFDFPAGSSIVAVLGTLFVLVLLIRLTKYLFARKEETTA
jgi:ABC-type Mn2+/Zn2+ transport system permease subunit